MAMGHVGIYWGEFLSPIPCAAIGLVYLAKGRWKKMFAAGRAEALLPYR
jgi:Na+-driven multidrug efflux pump